MEDVVKSKLAVGFRHPRRWKSAVTWVPQFSTAFVAIPFHIHKTTAWTECWHMLLSKVRLFSYSFNKNSGKKCLINAAVMPYLYSECGRTLKWIFTHHQTVNGYYNNKCPLAYSQFWHFHLMDKNTYFFPLYLLINDSWECDLHFRLVDWGCFRLWGRLTLLCAFALLFNCCSYGRGVF